METLRGYDNWLTTKYEPRQVCVCGHEWDDHDTNKAYKYDDEGNCISNKHLCDFWQDCGCDGFEITQD